ncbi:MAG TPA: universal stress protein [Acetobacteraceae bacterium]
MKLLVPVDGSTAALHAVQHALRLAEGHPGATIILLNVQNHQTLGLSDISDELLDERELAARQSNRELRVACRTCRDAGVRFISRSAFGPICETIDRVAREIHADQIIMGTRGLGHLAGMVLGSVGTGVVHLARIPVTLVKSGP